jgi:hypothetical protein
VTAAGIPGGGHARFQTKIEFERKSQSAGQERINHRPGEIVN